MKDRRCRADTRNRAGTPHRPLASCFHEGTGSGPSRHLNFGASSLVLLVACSTIEAGTSGGVAVTTMSVPVDAEDSGVVAEVAAGGGE
jgi:hypothetical protein